MTPSSVMPWHAPLAARLEQSLAAGRLPHALLLAGVPGLGKQRFAEAFAQRLHCREARPVACGRCEGCQQFQAGTHADHRHVTFEVNPDTEKLRQSIVVEQVRNCTDALWLTARYGGFKTAIIEPADGLNHAAANALLKTLEEPPANTVIVLVSARPSRLAATLRSRCQRLDFPIPPREQGLAWLAEESSRPDWGTWLDLAGGAPLAAHAMVQHGFAGRRADCARALQAVVEGRADPLQVSAAWAAEDPHAVLRWWATVVMDLILLAQAGPTTPLRNGDLRSGLQSMGQRLHLRPLHRFLDALSRSQALLESPVQPQLLLDALLIAWSTGLEQTALQPLLQDD